MSEKSANEKKNEDVHIGEPDQYQHSRFRCPECHRGMVYDEKKEGWFCRVHAGESDIAEHRDDNRGVYDTDDLDDLKEFIDEVKSYREMEKESDYEPDEEELEQFGGKSMGQSWVDFFTEKLKYLKNRGE